MSLRNILCGLILAFNCSLSCTEEDQIKEYGIVIFPSAEVAVKAAKMNTELQKLSGSEDPTNFWHVSLYHLACSRSDLNHIIGQLKALPLELFDLKFKDVYCTADRWIDWGMENTEPLHELHRKIVKIARPYKKWPLQRASDIYETLLPDKQAQVNTYGVSGVLELYTPHMTLFYRYPADTTLQEAAKQFAIENSEVEMSGNASSIGLVELGYNGNITKIIKCINLRTTQIIS